ncbi:sigma-70 family RNA polymerase sigma factor [Paraburkholderia caballeronis]|uniref:RNA polymerase sigma-70 factor, ECF subfamily n=1 Tax=Paraburkholderia caballeronis TaxID=416943 RepID=A0A1H7UAC3_9BURK|nr:sigma-70 family RNA polymerase sigma factor [Paraburkholderia caballeronis]PXW23317.1 RNA polymerase sigma-70 factor (ECF subfamily) [Paraburkholderia caballeronis]PXW98310.1 RNA polymerase sigma-70 factor (ECF subfamily) [Paraburkholderia caballeronis]RAJ95040.1 RNA polymerase sigma-70 factor (ECF subfamily) [Paraburkholderia caballeronis]TDV09452.1 RNA polymerase sigma-70 factor (ECF subfamily) [Paraburkholderia caballeronis]TDV13723.1 RNA polymerase sigma-70 factor (ECF subfamily) [Parab
MTAAQPPVQQEMHALYHDHHPWLQGWLRKRVGNAFDAADLAHDTFVRIIASRRALDLRTEPRALLAHIAKGLVVDHWRRQEVERLYLETIAHLPEPEVPSPEVRQLILESLCRIDAMLDTMRAATREVFLLAQLDGLTYAEIAARLGISLATVKRHMRAGFAACIVAL